MVNNLTDNTERKRSAEALSASEIKYRRLFEAAQDGILILDAETGMIVDVNPFLVELLGYSHKEFLGKKIWELGFFKDIVANQNNFLELQQQGYVRYEDKALEGRDGRRHEVEFVSNVYPVNSHKVIQCNIRDNTAHNRSAKAQREVETQYRSLFENMLNGFAHCRMLFEQGQPHDFVHLATNGAFEKLTGLKDVVGKKASEAMPGVQQTDPGLFKIFGRVARSRVSERFEIYVTALKKWFDIAVYSPRQDHFVAVFDVITERKQAETALRESEEQFRAMFEVASIGMAQADPQTGRWLRVNKKMCAITGYSVAELLQRRVSEITHPDDRQADSDLFQRVVRGEVADYRMEKRYIRKDGVVVWVNVNMTVIRDAAGQPVRTMATIEDITERKRSEAETRLQGSALRAAANAIVITDIAGTIISVNPAFTRLTGYRADEVIGQNPRVLKSGQHPPEFYAELWRTVTAGNSWHGELINRCKDGSLYTEEMTITPVRDATGCVTHFIAIKQDITKRKQAEEVLRESNRQLDQALEQLKAAQKQMVEQERLHALGQMASGIAHDFNNALAPILGFSELLLHFTEKARDPETVANFLQMINTCAQDAAHVVRRLREFYRHRERGEVFLPVNMNNLITQTVALTQPRWKGQMQATGINIDVQADLGDVPSVYCDESELREMLTNLIFNAVDAMPAGGTITVRTKADGEHVVVEISDTGTGMTDEVRQHCLEPFFSTKGERGTGLGLSMVYGVVQRHEGSIDIRSELGKGTTFAIRFPVEIRRGCERLNPRPR